MLKRRLGSIVFIVVGAAVFFYFYHKYRVAPDLHLEQLGLQNLDGSAFNAEELKGKTLFVNYWATWCGECLQEMPSIEAAYQQTDHEKVVFLMITDDSPEKVQNFLTNHPYPMKFVCLPQRLQQVGINTIPTSYIYTNEGEELFTHVGGLDWSDPGIVGLLKQP